jgi:uncharacterized damage-inducible protein DinB
MVLEEKVHAYLLGYSVVALENTPKVLDHLLGAYDGNDNIWNYRTSEDRFTLREVIAHIADWNHIYSERIRATLKEENPLLPNCDENQIAIDRRYATSDPQDNLARFDRTRQLLVDIVKEFEPTDWSRPAVREGLGTVTLDQQIAIIMGHDAYHVNQVLEYLEKASK